MPLFDQRGVPAEGSGLRVAAGGELAGAIPGDSSYGWAEANASKGSKTAAAFSRYGR